jgi:hypothetical protein
VVAEHTHSGVPDTHNTQQHAGGQHIMRHASDSRTHADNHIHRGDQQHTCGNTCTCKTPSVCYSRAPYAGSTAWATAHNNKASIPAARMRPAGHTRTNEVPPPSFNTHTQGDVL